MEKNSINKQTVSDIEIEVNVMQDILKNFGTTAFSIYIELLSYRNDATNLCNPSVNQLNKDYGTSIRTVKDNINKLYQAGFIDINSGSRHKSNQYFFPKEKFYLKWKEDYDQTHACRRKNKKQRLQEKKVAGIYLIENTINNKKYVGQAIDIRNRWIQHIQSLRNGTHCNEDLQTDYNKYGEDAFDFKVLEVVEDSPVLDIELDRKEKKWGKEYNVLEEGYNKAEFIDPFK